MDPLIIALIVAVFTLLVLFSGIPIAFGLSFVSIVLFCLLYTSPSPRDRLLSRMPSYA